MSYKVNWNDLIEYAQTILRADAAVIALVDSARILAQDNLVGGKLPAILVRSASKRSEDAVNVGNKPPEMICVLPIQVITFSKDSAGVNRDLEIMRQEAWNIVDEVERVIRDNYDWNENGDYLIVSPDRVVPDYDVDEKSSTIFFYLTVEITIRKQLAST